jgi:hypothetical protein
MPPYNAGPTPTETLASRNVAQTAPTRNVPPFTPPMSLKRKGFRKKVMFIGLAFFFGALIFSSFFLLIGNNTISGENITIGISGPFSVGGGEELSLQISISNQNTIPIESATLIIEYPNGTQSASEPGKELFSERQQLNNIGAGEAINIPIRAIVYGEENDEKVIKVSVEYRVRGSSATFYKEAEPLRFKISSSPVSMKIDSVKSISSGQETSIVLTITSNSPTPLSDILVKAVYPFGFDFSTSDPQPAAGRDTWLINSLKPEETVVITLRGVVVGTQDEERTFDFSVGVPNERDKFNLASVFGTGSTGIRIEQPFLGVDVAVNSSKDETVVISSGRSARVSISFKNVLEDTIYDGAIEAKLEGSGLSEANVDATGGFYDSNTNIIRWSGNEDNELTQIEPGRTRNVTFSLTPNESTVRTPEILLTVTVKGKRVFEDRVPQELIGTASRVLRVESIVELTTVAVHTIGPFSNNGPTPPVAERVTEYTFQFSLQNGSNDITDGVLTTTLPPYITWLNVVTAGDEVTYSPSTREMKWNIGDVSANAVVDAAVQVSFLPSLSQIGTTPTILETQRFKATDRFTGSLLRADSSALTTSLFTDPDEDAKNGRVRDSD